MQNNKLLKYVNKLLMLLLAAIFIYAGVSKIFNPAGFAEDIDNYRILPYLLVTVLAIILPWMEIISSLFLISGKCKDGALFILLGLSFIFLIAISSALIRSLDISCGCFSASNEATRIGVLKLVENILLLGTTAYLYFQSVEEKL